VGVPDPVVPLRLEAAEYRNEKGPFGQRLVFPVKLRWPDPAAKTSFVNPALVEPLMEGTVSLTLDPKEPRVKLLYQYKPLNAFWVDTNVQWEVLKVLSESSDLGIDWGKIDLAYRARNGDPNGVNGVGCRKDAVQDAADLFAGEGPSHGTRPRRPRCSS
jgi:hypothetical protein